MAKKQVKTTIQKHGKDFYKEIGSIGGNNTPSQFDKKTGQDAANTRWRKYYEDKARKEKIENGENQSDDNS